VIPAPAAGKSPRLEGNERLQGIRGVDGGGGHIQGAAVEVLIQANLGSPGGGKGQETDKAEE